VWRPDRCINAQVFPDPTADQAICFIRSIISNMGLSRIVYLSEAVKLLSHGKLRALVDGCSERNHAHGVSGLLLHSGGNFMQVLEGEEMVIATLYAKIAKDPRHKNVRTLLHRETDRRLFGDWGMQLANPGQVQSMDTAALDRALIRLRLAPDAQAVESDAINLLQEFRRQLMQAA
jgi:hypothetical protein